MTERSEVSSAAKRDEARGAAERSTDVGHDGTERSEGLGAAKVAGWRSTDVGHDGTERSEGLT